MILNEISFREGQLGCSFRPDGANQVVLRPERHIHTVPATGCTRAPGRVKGGIAIWMYLKVWMGFRGTVRQLVAIHSEENIL